MRQPQLFSELLQRVRRGDSDAATELVQRYESAVRVAVRTRLSDPRLRPRGSWLELARADQSDRWRQGHGVPAEEYFAQAPELREDDEEALVLIAGEIQLRRERGERPSADEYQRRFPALADAVGLQFDVDRILDEDASDASDEGDWALAPALPGYDFRFFREFNG